MIVQDLKPHNLAAQQEVARSMLSPKDPSTPPLEQAGGIPPLLDALDKDSCLKLQHEALDVISNLVYTSWEHTETLQNSGVISKLISFLALEGDLAERSILALGSFVLLGAEARGLVLRLGAVPAMLPHLRPGAPLRRRRTFVRAYSSLCSYHDDASFMLLTPGLPFICELLDLQDEEPPEEDRPSHDPPHKPHTASDLVEAACTALTNLTYGPDEHIEKVQAVPGLTERLVALLAHEGNHVKEAALGAVGNMLAGTDAQVDRCLEAGCLQHVVSLLRSSNPFLVQEAARAAANILAGTHAQIHCALEADILTALQTILTDGDPESLKQAGCAVTNLCMSGTAAQRSRVTGAVMGQYCKLLAHPDRAAAENVLGGLYALMQAAERDGGIKPLCYMLDGYEVLERMQQLQEHLTDEDHRSKISTMSVTLRKHAREERFIDFEDKHFTAETIVRDLESEEHSTHARAVRAACCMLREHNPPAHAFLEAGVMSPIIAGLEKDSCHILQCFAAWALGNLTDGTDRQRMVVAHCGALPKVVGLLPRGNDVAIPAAIALGRVASYGPQTREAILTYMRSETGSADLRTYLRTLDKRIYGEPNERIRRIVRALPLVSELLAVEDVEVIKDACRACECFMAGSVELVQTVPGLLPRMVALLGHGDTSVQAAALIAIITMLSGTPAQNDRCLDAGVLDHIAAFLMSSERSMVGLAVAATSRIFRESSRQRALDQGILGPLKHVLATGDYRYEDIATYAISALCTEGLTMEQRTAIVASGVLQPLCKLLEQPGRELMLQPGRKMAQSVLDSLHWLLKTANGDKDFTPLCLYLDNLDVESKLRPLLSDEKLRFDAEMLLVILKRMYTPEELVQDLQSQDLEVKMRGARVLNRSLCSCLDPPRAAIVGAGVIPPLVAALDRNDCYDLQLAVTSALCQVLRGRDCHKDRVAAVNAGAIPKLVSLLSNGGELAGQAAVALRLIVYRAATTRDLVLSHGAVPALLAHMRADTPVELLRTCVNTYAALCKIPIVWRPTFELLSAGLPYLFELLNIEDTAVICSACVVLSRIAHGPVEYIGAVLAVPGLPARLVALLGHAATDVKAAALQAVGNMFAGTISQVDCLLEAGFLDHIVPLLRAKEPSLVEGAVRDLCNLFSTSPRQIQLALDKDILDMLLKILAGSQPNSYLQYNAVKLFTGISRCGSREHKLAAVNVGVVPYLISLLSHGHAVALSAAVALGNLQTIGTEMREVVLAQGAMPALLPHLQPDNPMDLLKTCVAIYRNLCHANIEKEEIPQFDQLLPALPYLADLLIVTDKDILMSICEALAGLLLGPEEQTEAVQVVPGMTRRVVALLGHEDPEVKEKALQAVANMLSGTHIQATRCLDAGFLDHIVDLLQSHEPTLLDCALASVRNLLRHTHSHTDRVLRKGILGPLLNVLANKEYILLSRATCSFLEITNKGTQEHRIAVLECGAVPKLVALLPRGDEVAAVAALVLGDLARLGPETRDLVLSHGVVAAMLSSMSIDTPTDLLQMNVMAYNDFLYSRTYEGGPGVDLSLVAPALPYVYDILALTNKDILVSACWALVGVSRTSGGVETLLAVPGLVARFLGLVGHEATTIKDAVMTTMMYILSGTETQVERCLAAGCVERLLCYLQCREPSLLQEAARATRAALGAEHPRARRALREDTLTPLMRILVCHPEGQQRTLSGIANMYRRATAVQRYQLVSSGVLEPYCALLAQPGCAVAGEALDALRTLLQVAEDDGSLQPLCLKLIEIGVHEEINHLLEHDNEEVNEKARRILHTYEFTKE